MTLKSAQGEFLAAAAFVTAELRINDRDSRIKLGNIWANGQTFLRKKLPTVTVRELQEFTAEQRAELFIRPFTSAHGRALWLIPLWMYNYVADGEVLINILDRAMLKGADEMTLESQGGSTSWGFV
jgi:hypothetical protein